MDLHTYQEVHHLTQAELSKLLGISIQSIGNYLKGRRCPSDKIKHLLFQRTKGKITPNDLVKYYFKKKGV